MPLTLMHGSHHAGDEFVDTVTFLDQRHKSSNTTLVVGMMTETRKNNLLESINMILQSHQIIDSFETMLSPKLVLTLLITKQTTYPSLGSSIFFKLMYSS